MAENTIWVHAANDPDHLALVEPDGSEHTAAEVVAASNQLVHGLRALGLSKGDVVAVALPNSAAVVEANLACLQSGWYLVPVNWHLAAPEIAYILKDSGAKAFVAHARFAEVARAAVAEADFPADNAFVVGGAVEGFRAYEDLKRGQPTGAPEDRSTGDVMNYTAGTTGAPKGVKRPTPQIDPDTNCELNALFWMLFGVMPKDGNVHIVGSPLYHTAVMRFAMNSLHMGHTVVLMDKWEPEMMLYLIQKYRVTTSHMVPTQFHRLLQLPEKVRAKYDVSSLQHMVHSAAPCPVDIKHAMLEWWGPVIDEYYAATEGGGTLATPEQWLKKPGTVGTKWPISEIKIIDDDGDELPPNEIGTVWIKMGDYRFEYHGDAEKTKRTWNEQGFFTVGDVGYLDEDEFLFLCDRKADMVISGGVNIYPAEIESQLITHPKVQDVAVFGIPHTDWGEELKAVVQPVAGASTDGLAEELAAFCTDRLAKFKIPRTFDFIDDMPRDDNGKLYKRKLRDPYWAGKERQI